jgi:ketosteroid isomerase-like protein
MPSANVKLVRSIYASWERGDFSSSAWADPEIEFARVDGPVPGSWRGSAQIAAAAREMLTAWEDFRLAAAEYRELDGNRVLVFASGTARGKRTGVELRASAANLFHIANGKVTRLVTYYDRDRALADAGRATPASPTS